MVVVGFTSLSVVVEDQTPHDSELVVGFTSLVVVVAEDSHWLHGDGLEEVVGLTSFSVVVEEVQAAQLDSEVVGFTSFEVVVLDEVH